MASGPIPASADSIVAVGDRAEVILADAWNALRRGEPGVAFAAIQEGPETPAIDRLRAVIDRLDGPKADPDPSHLVDVVSPGMAVARSAHFVLYHEGSDAAAVSVLAILEKVANSLVLGSALLGFEPEIPAERQVVVRFANDTSYRAFLKAEGAGSLVETTGYYHPTRRIVVLFDLERAPADAPCRRRLGRLDLAAVAVGTATHEVAHQWIMATGLCRDLESFPHWLHEGLAMQFEAAPRGVWSGFGAVEPIRLADWRRMPKGHPLRAIVRDEGLDRGYNQGRYAESWALVYYLLRDRPADLAALIDRLRLPRDPDRPLRDHYEDAFRATFGEDWVTLEREWIRAIPATPITGANPGMLR